MRGCIKEGLQLERESTHTESSQLSPLSVKVAEDLQDFCSI